MGINLAQVLRAWNTVVQDGSTRDLATLLDHDVVWQGALPGNLARGREEVLAVLEDNDAPQLNRIEVHELGDRVLLTMEGPDFPRTEGHVAGVPVLVFSLRGGRIVRLETIGRRETTPNK